MEMNELKEIAEFLFNKELMTHVSTKDESFYNGIILELHETFIVLHDRVIGETPIAFSEMEKLEKFRGKDE